MAGSPKWKVYRGGEYIAACKYPEDAAALAYCCGDAHVRAGHAAKYTVWREGQEEFSAGHSYDDAAAIMRERLRKINEAAYVKAHGKLPDGYATA